MVDAKIVGRIKRVQKRACRSETKGKYEEMTKRRTRTRTKAVCGFVNIDKRRVVWKVFKAIGRFKSKGDEKRGKETGDKRKEGKGGRCPESRPKREKAEKAW